MNEIDIRKTSLTLWSAHKPDNGFSSPHYSNIALLQSCPSTDRRTSPSNLSSLKLLLLILSCGELGKQHRQSVKVYSKSKKYWAMMTTAMTVSVVSMNCCDVWLAAIWAQLLISKEKLWV